MTLPTIPAFEHTLAQHALPLTRSRPRVLQINLGKLCNLTCVHCHVNAGPHRTEIMRSDCVDHILDWLAHSSIESLDLTGGTPEMIPDFRRLVIAARQMGKKVMNRCNLTILNEPGYEWVADFHREQQVHLIASMPCYSPDNVNAQRGEGVFDSSIQALQTLNALAMVNKRICNWIWSTIQWGRAYHPIKLSWKPTTKLSCKSTLDWSSISSLPSPICRSRALLPI